MRSGLHGHGTVYAHKQLRAHERKCEGVYANWTREGPIQYELHLWQFENNENYGVYHAHNKL